MISGILGKGAFEFLPCSDEGFEKLKTLSQEGKSRFSLLTISHRVRDGFKNNVMLKNIHRELLP